MARKGRRQYKKQLSNTTKGTIQKQETEQTEEIVNNVDEHGFYSDGTYAKTGEIYDERGFKIDGTNIYTHGKFDKRGFDIKGYFNGINGVKYDYAGFDKDGYNSKGFDSNGRHKDTNGFYGPDGKNSAGFTKKQQMFKDKMQELDKVNDAINSGYKEIERLENEMKQKEEEYRAMIAKYRATIEEKFNEQIINEKERDRLNNELEKMGGR